MVTDTRTILVVDDEERIVEILERFLLGQGFKVWTAHDGKYALELMKSGESVDLIILDEKMPGMSGTAFRRELEKHGEDIPVILLTGSIGMLKIPAEDRRMYKHMLIKPVRLADLLKLIKKILK